MQNDWKLLVEHCFRSGNCAFAPEFFEYQTAVRMFEVARRAGASDQEILSTIRGLKRDFAQFRRQFTKLQAEFKDGAEAIHAHWERTDRLMWTHMRDMEEFRNSQEKRLARQRENEREEGGKVEEARH